MAVRFVPVDEPPAPRPDRENLAEVIDLRSRLVEPREPTDEGTHHLPEVNADAVRLLARRALSAQELRDRLVGLGHAEHDVELVLAEFVDRHYLDDTGLARSISEKLRQTKRASKAQIRRELAKRRIPSEHIDAALSDIDDADEEELLWEVAIERSRRLTALDRTTAERRLLGYLARRGWNGSSVRSVASAALDEALGAAR